MFVFNFEAVAALKFLRLKSGCGESKFARTWLDGKELSEYYGVDVEEQRSSA